jgi:hypothetical protein
MSVTSAVTMLAVGVANVNVLSGLQYWLYTTCALAWSSDAVEPQLALTEREISVDMAAKLLFFVHTHDWSSVTASPQAEYVCPWML